MGLQTLWPCALASEQKQGFICVVLYFVSFNLRAFNFYKLLPKTKTLLKWQRIGCFRFWCPRVSTYVGKGSVTESPGVVVRRPIIKSGLYC